VRGRIERAKEPDPDVTGFHGIRFEFNRKDFGRLRRLIDLLNKKGADGDEPPRDAGQSRRIGRRIQLNPD
jgi:hypothetical protein